MLGIEQGFALELSLGYGQATEVMAQGKFQNRHTVILKGITDNLKRLSVLAFR